jgi:hypothetical protein
MEAWLDRRWHAWVAFVCRAHQCLYGPYPPPPSPPVTLLSVLFSVQVVLVTLIKAIPGMFSVCALVLILWLVFAVLGVSIFKGSFYSCSDTSITARQQCLDSGAEWVNNYGFNFDGRPWKWVPLLLLCT